jgi:hypothetical protein
MAMLGSWFPTFLSFDDAFHALYWAAAAGMLIAELALVTRRPIATGRAGVHEVVWAVVPALLLLGFGTLGAR